MKLSGSLLPLTDVDVSGELVDPSNGGSESPGGLVHSGPPEEGSFSGRLRAREERRRAVNVLATIYNNNLARRVESGSGELCPRGFVLLIHDEPTGEELEEFIIVYWLCHKFCTTWGTASELQGGCQRWDS